MPNLLGFLMMKVGQTSNFLDFECHLKTEVKTFGIPCRYPPLFSIQKIRTLKRFVFKCIRNSNVGVVKLMSHCRG